jgi:chromosome segregation ATPase
MEKKAQCNESEERILDLSADVAKWRMIANKRTSDAGIPSDGQRVSSPAEIDRLRQELSSVRRALSDKEREVRELKDKEEQWRRERENQIPSDHYRVQIQQVQADNNDLVREVNELKRTCDELRQRSRAVPTYNTYELDRIKEENASLKKQLDTLQETNLLVHHQVYMLMHIIVLVSRLNLSSSYCKSTKMFIILV